MAEQPVPLGKIVTGLRTQRGLSLSELARQVGISKGHLHQIENGRQEPRIGLACRLAKTLGVTVEDLISVDGESVIECPTCEGKGWIKGE